MKLEEIVDNAKFALIPGSFLKNTSEWNKEYNFSKKEKMVDYALALGLESYRLMSYGTIVAYLLWMFD